VTSKLQAFSRFVADIHALGGEVDIETVMRFGLEWLRAELGFESAWYGWCRFHKDHTTVPASATINLPDNFASFWSTIERDDMIARNVRQNRNVIGLYSRSQPQQTDGMIALSERYQLRKIACAIHHRPSRSSAFFVSIYRSDLNGHDWSEAELQLFQCAVDHIFLAMQKAIETPERGLADQATLIVDASGLTHLGHERSLALLRAAWPGWQSEWLPKPLLPCLRAGATNRLKSRGLVVSCEPDTASGVAPQLLRVKLRPAAEIDALTAREMEVAQLLAGGATHRQVADALGSSPATIRNQTQSIYAKLSIGSRAQLAEAVLRRSPVTNAPPAKARPRQNAQTPAEIA